jgi:hypothetical protein
MSVQLHTRMRAALADACETGVSCPSRLSWVARSALAVSALAAVSFIDTPTATAVPSYARQTGQPCATCHTAFPELTPYGRQFKLMGYTSGGTRCNDGSAKSDETQIPIALMSWPATFTHINSKDAVPNGVNDSAAVSQQSIFVAGQLYCDVGAFAQVTWDGPAQGFHWDNVDIRYAKTGTIDGTSVVYGITANNNPTVQDPWNTVPAWIFPYIASPVAHGPSGDAGTMLGSGMFGQQVGSVGGYVWINSMIYAELSAYGNLSQRLLTDLAGSAVPAANNRFSGLAPYWRLAAEKTWDKNSLMVGTFGMFANVQPTGGDTVPLLGSVVDPTLDLAVDAQYQYLGETHGFTVRTSYIWEKKKNNVERNPNQTALFADNLSDQLNEFNFSATYLYDRTISLTGGYFATWGTGDASLYTPAFGSSAVDTRGFTADLAYLPFSHGGPELWPWFNARIGVLYTHFDQLNGVNNSIPGAKASNNDSVFLYTWLMF